MNYLIVIIVDNANEANYRIMLYTESAISAFSADFIFNINRKTNDFFENNNFFLRASFIRGKES